MFALLHVKKHLVDVILKSEYFSLHVKYIPHQKLRLNLYM